MNQLTKSELKIILASPVKNGLKSLKKKKMEMHVYCGSCSSDNSGKFIDKKKTKKNSKQSKLFLLFHQNYSLPTFS